MTKYDILLTLLLTTTEPSVEELPPPQDEYVYCWLSTERDEKGKLIGFTERCNNKPE